MTATIEQACGDLAQYLPVAAALIASPDTTPGPGTRTQPGSRPPWNAEKANLVHGAIAALNDIEAELRQAVTGTIRPRRPYRQTGAMLTAIASLAHGAPGELVKDAQRTIEHAVTAIAQSPAIDIEERPRRILAPCRYCGYRTVCFKPHSWTVTCTRQYACFDGRDQHPVGELVAYPDGSACIFWADGQITLGALETEPQP